MFFDHEVHQNMDDLGLYIVRYVSLDYISTFLRANRRDLDQAFIFPMDCKAMRIIEEEALEVYCLSTKPDFLSDMRGKD